MALIRESEKETHPFETQIKTHIKFNMKRGMEKNVEIKTIQ